MKLSESDMRLLAYLYHSDREHFTKIAKETGLTRKQVEYKIKKFEAEGVIKKYLTLFNYEKLGHGNYVFLFVKLENPSVKDEFIKKIEGSKNLISWGDCFGKYDIFMNLIFKNEEKLSDFLSRISKGRRALVADSLVIKPYLAEFHPLKIFGSRERKKLPLVFAEKGKLELDKNEVKIIKALEENGKRSIVDIANDVGISAELALYKIRGLYKKGVILGSRLHLDMKKLGYNYSGVFVHFKFMPTGTRDKVLEFARSHKLVNAITLSVGNPSCFIQIFHKTEDELKEVINDFKKKFSDVSFDLDVLLMNEEDKINTLPFL